MYKKSFTKEVFLELTNKIIKHFQEEVRRIHVGRLESSFFENLVIKTKKGKFLLGKIVNLELSRAENKIKITLKDDLIRKGESKFFLDVIYKTVLKNDLGFNVRKQKHGIEIVKVLVTQESNQKVEREIEKLFKEHETEINNVRRDFRISVQKDKENSKEEMQFKLKELDKLKDQQKKLLQEDYQGKLKKIKTNF